MPAYGGPRYTIVQLLHRMWPRRSTIAELMPHCATPGEFSASHHPEGPSPGSLKNITPLTFEVSLLCGGLMSAPPSRPSNDEGWLNAPLRQSDRDAPDLLHRPGNLQAWR